MTTSSPAPVPVPSPSPTPLVESFAPRPVRPAQDPGVPVTTPTVVPASERKRAPPPVTPGAGIGTSVTSINSVPPLADITTDAADITPASTTGNTVIPTITRPGGNVGAIQFNNGNAFGGNANLTFAQGGLWVGGVSSSANASGIITTKNDFRAGTWSPIRSSAENPAFSRLRFVANAPNANTSFYGFNSDYQVIQQQCTVVTNENVTTTAMVLMEGIAYNEEYASVQPGTIFGISVNNGFGDPISTGNEYGWQRLMQLDNWGTLSVGGNISIKPNFNYIYNNENPNEPGRFGIVFADGSYQWHAPIIQKDSANVVANASIVNFVGPGVTVTNANGIANISISSGNIVSGIAVQEEGSNVVATANTINFVGAGVTASNVGGVATITIPGGNGSGIVVQEESSNVLSSASTLNFVGAGVTASNVGGVATITVPGSSGISGVNILYNASVVTANATTINFFGPLANVTNVGVGNATDVGIGLTVQDESTVVTGNAAIGTLNFLGAGVTVTAGPTGVANITIPSGGGTPGSPNASIQFNDGGSFAGNTYFTFNKTNGNVDMALGNLTVSNGNITGYTNGIPLGYKYLPGNSVTGNRDISSSDIGGYIVKWGNSDITLTTPGFPGDSNLPVGTKIEIFNANPTGNANIVAGSGGGTSTVLVGPRPNAEGILSYVQVGPYEQVTMVKLGASASNVYTGNSVVWFCYGSAYPLGVAYP
jgi:hypothetical protein